MEQIMEDITPKIKLNKKSQSDILKPLTIDHENHPSLQRIVDAFENSDKVTLGYSTLEKDDSMSKPSLKKKLIYLTGASLRDHLFNKTFQKYELVTNATPEEIRMILNFYKFSEFKPYDKKNSSKYSKLEATSMNPFKYYVSKWDSYGNEMGFEIIVRNQVLHLDTLDKNPKYLLEAPNLRKFTSSIHDDAMSRDISVNAIYLKLKNSDGENTELYDPIRGVHDIIHGEINLIGKDHSKFEKNPDLMFKLVEASTRFAENNKLSENNLNIIKSNYPKVKNLPKLFKKSYISAISNEDVPTYHYLKNLYVSGLLFKLFPKLKITPPSMSLFDDYVFITAYILQNNNDGLIFSSLTSMDWHKFEIKEIVFVKSLIDWAKNNDEDLLKKILIQFTDIPVKKTIDFMKIFNKEKEFKRLLEKYSSGII